MNDYNEYEQRTVEALSHITNYGQYEGEHHKLWLIDQVVRSLTGCPTVEKTGIDYRGNEYKYYALGESDEYRRFVAKYEDGGLEWDTGIAP